jgi:hypothetical protein
MSFGKLNEIITATNNKIKTTWNVLEVELCKRTNKNNIQEIKLNDYSTDNPQVIAFVLN